MNPTTTSPTPSPTETDGPLSTDWLGYKSDEPITSSLSAISWSDIESDDPVRRKLQAIVDDEDVEFPTPPELQAVGRLYFCFGDEINGCFVCSGECCFRHLFWARIFDGCE